MEIQEIKNLSGNKSLLAILGIILCLFLIALIVSTTVEIMNKIKEGRYIGRDIESLKTITVSGTGEIYAKPDLAIVDFSVVTEAKTVAKAMEDNTAKMNAIIDFMKEQGIEDKDLKTISFYIYPRYEWYDTETCVMLFGTPCPSGRRVLVGYEVTQSLQVKIRDMAKIGDIIQGGTDKGANQVGDLQFTIDKEDEVKKQAREQAITEAKTKAGELASQLGVKLTRIVNFNESGIFPYYETMKEAVPAGLGGGVSAPQIQTGENKIEITVNITYEID